MDSTKRLPIRGPRQAAARKRAFNIGLHELSIVIRRPAAQRDNRGMTMPDNVINIQRVPFALIHY